MEVVNNNATEYLEPGGPISFFFDTGSGSNTINILNTAEDIPIGETGPGNDTVNLGSGNIAQEFPTPVYIENPAGHATININDSADQGGRYGPRSMPLSAYSAGGTKWGATLGLTYNIMNPLNVSTVPGRVVWNVSANAMTSAGASVVKDNGLAVNSVPTEPAAGMGYSPAPANAPLFHGGRPSYLDVSQGDLGDCWLLSSLAEVAARDPQDIENMFTYDGTIVDNGATVGLYTVRFFNGGGSPVSVQVDTELPNGGSFCYDQVTNPMGTQALWVALAEKAYAEANGLGYVGTSAEHQDSYNALNGGDPAWALQAITGKPAVDYYVNPTNIASAWNSGNLVVLCTSTPQSSYIVGDHCYAVVGYNASSSQPFEVFNPWGTTSSTATPSNPAWAPYTGNTIYGLFWASPSFLSQNFAIQGVGTGAINPDHLAAATNELAGSAAVGDGYATTGTIRLIRYRPGGRVAGAETAAGHPGHQGEVHYTRPAQGTASGTDHLAGLTWGRSRKLMM
jgi:hypothetical protein